MRDIEKDLHGRKHYKSFYWKQFRNNENQQNSKKPGRIRKKTVKNLNDQECVVYPMNSVKMHLLKS